MAFVSFVAKTENSLENSKKSKKFAEDQVPA